MTFKKIFLVLFMIVWIGLAGTTLIPRASAHHVSYLGYRAFCSFAPFSTLILLAAAGVTYLILRKIA
jgi:hypothetical protein